jgi:hypothetical protein
MAFWVLATNPQVKLLEMLRDSMVSVTFRVVYGGPEAAQFPMHPVLRVPCLVVRGEK